MCGLEPEVPEEIVLLRRIIDFVLTQFSWSFMLVILAAGIWCSAVAGRTGPIHVGAPRDTTGLDMTAAAPRNGGSSTLQQLLVPPASAVLAPKRDLALEELQDEPAARSLTLPRADEQARQQALQELEDERLERCRASDAFDQCFFFGATEAMDARRPMEGAGVVSATLPRGVGAYMEAAPRDASGTIKKLVPTW